MSIAKSSERRVDRARTERSTSMSDETSDISIRNRRVNSGVMKTVSTVAGKLSDGERKK